MTHRTIRGRIVWAIVLVGCIPLVIGLALAYVSGMRSLRDVIGGNLQAVAVQAADEVTMLVQGEVRNVRLLGSAPLRVRFPVQEANAKYPADGRQAMKLIDDREQLWQQGSKARTRLLNAELSRFLLETKNRDGNKLIGLLIVDRHGALVAASSDPNRYFFANEPWWKAIHGSNDDVYLSGVIPPEEGLFEQSDETLDIAVPIFDDKQQRMIGAVVASYRFESLFAMIAQIKIGQTGHAMLFNAAGQPLVCPILAREAHRIPSQLMAMIVSSEAGWAIAEDDGHGASDTVVGYAPVNGLKLPDNTWHLFVRQQPGESYAPIHDQMRNLAAIGLVMLGLLWAMGRYVATQIARPIQLLKSGVEAISQGRYDEPVNIKTADEFEDLSAAVRRMADRLKASRAELEGLNRDLARRVEEKTQEITKHMQSLELAERLATLGKIASGIAHEINNPLGIILNRIECMEDDAVRLPMPAELKRDLLTIRAHAERISRVTKSILTFSRGTISTLKPVDMNTVVRSCLVMAGEQTSAHRVQFTTALAASLPPVLGDRDRLETVLLNLINNGIEAVSSGQAAGWVHIQTSIMDMEGQPWVQIQVADNGPGVPDASVDRIFDPFFTTKAAGQGTGLGLYLTYGIVADHRGRIEVNNGGPGAIFTVVLPAVGSVLTSLRGAAWESQEKS